LSDVADLIADLVNANVPPELVGRVAAALAGGKAMRAKPAKNAYTEDFEAFWKAYPTDANMSKLEAWQQWQKIDATERQLATKAIPKFIEYCKANEWYRPAHAVNFLKKKRFEGHAAQPELTLVSSQSGTYVMQDSPEWSQYADAYRKATGKTPPVDKRGGWFFKEAI
jgi:hypothetical protein